MNPEVKSKWVTALRSGKYKQGTGQLALENGDGSTAFCCLGVLCDLAVKEGKIEEFNPESGYQPNEVGEWAGFAPEPEAKFNNDEWDRMKEEYQNWPPRKLAEMNDEGQPFTAIADYIEENL